jgi:2-keto-4-pentenoate hydratase/2-oxohepta-3-ene-1,7-dioic acid hydratase in catechol pathway
MRLAVFADNRLGVVEDDSIFDVTEAMPWAWREGPPVFMSRLIEEWEVMATRVRDARAVALAIPLATVTLAAPSPRPTHVVAAPANYRKHIGEIGARSVSKGRSAAELGFFLKAPSSVSGVRDGIRLPRESTRRFDHESELAVIIGREAKNVPRAKALEYVFGYSCLLDLTMRIEPGVAEEERATRKSFDTFTPVGPYVVTADEVPDPHVLDIRLWVNDELRQNANTRDLIVDIPTLIELASSVLTLYPGDIIATGTPDGVGPIKVGDVVRIAIEQVGTMSVPVAEAEAFAPRRF